MNSPEHYQEKHPVGSWWLLPVQVTAHLPIEPDDFSPRPLRLATKSVYVDIPQRDLDSLLPFATEEYTMEAGTGAVCVTYTATGNLIAEFQAVPDMEHAWNRAMQLFKQLQTEEK